MISTCSLATPRVRSRLTQERSSVPSAAWPLLVIPLISLLILTIGHCWCWPLSFPWFAADFDYMMRVMGFQNGRPLRHMWVWVRPQSQEQHCQIWVFFTSANHLIHKCLEVKTFHHLYCQGHCEVKWWNVLGFAGFSYRSAKHFISTFHHWWWRWPTVQSCWCPRTRGGSAEHRSRREAQQKTWVNLLHQAEMGLPGLTRGIQVLKGRVWHRQWYR